MDWNLLDDLLLNISSLASIYHKPPSNFINGIKSRKLIQSPALNPNIHMQQQKTFNFDEDEKYTKYYF